MLTTCQQCQYQYLPAKSKRENNCPNCLHLERTGESLVDMKKRKARESLEASRKRSAEKQLLKPKTDYKIPKTSEKGAIQAKEVAKTKRKLKQGAKDGDYFECNGCGKFVKQIDGSHRTPLSKNTELAAEPGNIQLLCRECHNKYENGTVPEMITLKCLVQDLRYLFDNNPERFWKIHFRMVDEYNARPTPRLSKVLGDIERFDA